MISSVISNVPGSVVKRTVCKERTELTSAQIQAVLSAHNLHRSQADNAADMRKLVWSDQMASRAQNDANRCSESGHNQCDPNGETGPKLSLFDYNKLISQYC